MSEKAEGWAVADAGGILVRTVSPTRRGAIVNWLVSFCGVLVHSGWKDDMIETQFVTRSLAHRARVVEVLIEEKDE